MTDDARLIKRPTGLSGLDAVTGGGLPAAGATLIVGGPGSGKTVLTLQILAFAAREGTPGIFVSFEETGAQIRRDAASFEWGETIADESRIALVDARPPPEAEASGSFDLEGLLSALGQQAEQLGAAWIALDGIDRLLALEPDAATAVAHIAALNRWCEERDLSLLLTGKQETPGAMQPQGLAGVEFMLSTVIVLATELVGRRLNRRFRIAKYRGTAHVADELALVIDDAGVHVPYDPLPEERAPATTERIGSGVARLDDVLAGGPFRGSTTLISGQPGTAKTTLAVSFAHAAAERGERVLFVSFDELADRIVRNVASVGFDLARHVADGRVRFETREAWNTLIEAHYIRMMRVLGNFEPHLLVIDPVSALLKAASAENAHTTTERLIDWARSRGITTVLTSLVEGDDPTAEGTASHVSTLADTWISLGYMVRGGERNRTLSVVKSRGTPHSNQVRELMLSADGPDLADVYEYGTEVLLGTARLEKEREEAARARRETRESQAQQRELERRLREAQLRRQELDSELERIEEELEGERERADAAARESAAHREDVKRRRDPRRTPRGREEPPAGHDGSGGPGES